MLAEDKGMSDLGLAHAPSPRRRVLRRLKVVIAVAAVTSVSLPLAPAQAVSKDTLFNVLTAAAADYKAAKTYWYGFPTHDRVLWSAKTTTGGKYLTAVRARVSAADTKAEVDAVSTYVYRERTRARVFRSATVLAAQSFTARRAAVSAGQAAFTDHVAGSLPDAAYAEVRHDSAAVAALAAKDRRRAWAALLSTTAPAASQAKAAVPALSSSATATAPTGWIGVPGGCAVSTASSTWLGAAGQPGVHLWVDEATVAEALLRSKQGSSLARAAHASLMRSADALRTPITTDLAAVATPIQKRSQRLGYAALLGDADAASWLKQDLQSVLPPGPQTGNTIRDAISLEGLATDLDWTGLDELATPEAAALREVMLVRWLGPLSCRFDDVEATVVDPDNITVIVDTAVLHAALALSTAEPDLAAALAHTALVRLQPGLVAMTQDGGSFEGPSYWNFQSQYLAAVYGTTRSVYGDDPPLALPSPSRAPAYAWSSTTADSTSLAFSDSLVAPEVLRPGLVSWVAHRTSDARAGAMLRASLQAPTTGYQVLWWPTDAALSAPTPTRVSTLFPRTGLAALQAPGTTAWLKGGSSEGSHAHLDLGTVGFHKDGIDWAVDPGQDDYSLPGYSSRALTSPRWTYWKVSAAGHSTLHAPAGQPPLKVAPFLAFAASSDAPSAGAGRATLDLRSVLPGSSAATRTASLSTSGRLTVVDRVRSSLARSWVWGWVTEASVSVSGSGSTRAVVLAQAGHTARIDLAGLPAGTTVSVVDAPSGAVGPTGKPLRVVTVTTGTTTSLVLTARVS
jgi:hypothetical protein